MHTHSSAHQIPSPQVPTATLHLLMELEGERRLGVL